MKSLKPYLTALGLLLAGTGAAQTPDQTFKVDFSNLQKKYEFEIDVTKTFVVQVDNINRSLYKIDGVKTETDYNIALPTALTGIKTPAYLFTSVPSNKMASSPSMAGPVEKIMAELERINTLARQLDNATLLFNNLAHVLKNCTLNQAGALKQTMEETNFYIKGNRDYGNTTPAEMRQALADYMAERRPQAEKVAKQLHADIEIYAANAAENLQKILDSTKASLTGHQSKLKGLSAGEAKESLKGIIIAEQQSIADHPKALTALPGLVTQLKENEGKALSAIEDMRKFEKDDKPFAILKQFDLAANPAAFSFTSELITAKTDEIKYVITIDPTELTPCANAKKVIEVTVKINGGWKLDFSTGLFINSGNADFLGQAYYYQNIDDTHRQIVTADRGSRALLSVGALMHFYKRSTAFTKLGFSLGVSTTSAVTDLLFHAGPSLFFGHENRVVLSGGLTLKSAALLDQKLQTNTIYTKLQSPDAIPTVTVFPRSGYFFALTYNFSKFKSSK